MKRSGFTPKSYDEKLASLKEKQARQAKLPPKPEKPATVKNEPKKRKEKTQAQLKKDLDAIFSIYIRQKYADDMENVECYTCFKMLPIKKIQNGHFVSRQYLATRWHENNCRPQCWGCNGFGGGKPLDFEERLKKELGSDYVEEMKASRHQSLKLDRNWYLAEIERYKSMVQ